MILLISVVFDVSEKIDDFYRREAPLKKIIFDYYVNFIIHYGLLFSALFTFIAVIISTSKLAKNSEIIAILNSGWSLKRLLRPYLIGATLIASISFYLNNWLLPTTNEIRLEFEQEFIRNKKSERFKNIHRQIKPGHFIFMESFNTKKQKGFRFSYEIFREGHLISKFKSDFITWNEKKELWLAENYNFRKLNQLGEKIEKGAKIEKDFGFYPSELIYQKSSTNMMILPELNNFIEKEKKRGAENIHYYFLDLYQRYMTPLTTFILTLIGFSLAIHKKRDGTGLNLVYGFILTTLFILFQKISITFTTNSNLDPFLAILLPNLIFGVLAYYLFQRAER